VDHGAAVRRILLGFTFGATAPIRMAGHGDAGAIAQLAPYLFAGANNRGRPDHARGRYA